MCCTASSARYYTKTGRLIPTAKRGKENKAVKLKQEQYICPIFWFEKQTFYGGSKKINAKKFKMTVTYKSFEM